MRLRRSNREIQAEIRRELEGDPAVDAGAIGVGVDSGLVTLSGHVLGVGQRRSAESDALRVEGVRAVVDELRLRPGPGEARDLEVAREAAEGLAEGDPGRFVVREGRVRRESAAPRPAPVAPASGLVVGEAFTDEGVPMSRVHHREFPEMLAEGETLADGLSRLGRRLAVALEHARDPWRREAVERALFDLREYQATLGTGR